MSMKDSNLSLVEVSPSGEANTCSVNKGCGKTKPVSEFYESKKGRQGLMHICKDCDNARRRDNRKKNPRAHRNTQLKYLYGITADDWDQMFADQKGRCASCGIHQSEIEIVFFVDHDHETNDVRELLCQPCNSTIGYAKEDPDRLERCAEYMRKHQ